MKFRNQARLCLAVSDFDAHNMFRSMLSFEALRTSAQDRKNLTPLPYPCGHTVNFEKFKVFIAPKKCGLPHLKILSSLVHTGQITPECRRLLWTAP